MPIYESLDKNFQLLISSPRIISLVPSLTETIVDLGCEEQLVGITKFCVNPGHLKGKIPIIGGTKNLNLNKIISLNPELIIANKEENVKSDILLLANNFPVLLTDIKTLDDSQRTIDYIGYILDREKESGKINVDISNSRESFRNTMPKAGQLKKVCYLIWKDPYMTIGFDTFIHSMLTELGFVNVFGNKERYPEVSLSEIYNENPDYVFLSSEPYPFKEVHFFELKGLNPILVDGEAFSWYGSHIIKSFDYLCKLINKLV
ncbi:MAG: ABC transporter substrate-binding protein [Saprospiraceae bacterium]|nr:ABC transporter substrate-binding protein [Saprospiraceae bacterium]